MADGSLAVAGMAWSRSLHDEIVCSTTYLITNRGLLDAVS